jgi:hypothetical protein
MAAMLALSMVIKKQADGVASNGACDVCAKLQMLPIGQYARKVLEEEKYSEAYGK